MNQNIKIHYLSIPNEIFQHIASFLNFCDCGRLAMVSKFFFHFLDIKSCHLKYIQLLSEQSTSQPLGCDARLNLWILSYDTT
jgi:hypothetical protein